MKKIKFYLMDQTSSFSTEFVTSGGTSPLAAELGRTSLEIAEAEPSGNDLRPPF